MKKAERLMPRGDIIETLIRIAVAPIENTHWRTAKWNGSPMFIRAAAAGLEANDSRTPRMMRMPVAPSRRWSTVHHQTPVRVRSVRGKACC